MSQIPATPGVIFDVTTIQSAQEYLLAQNERRSPDDPFAAQCYVELTQSLIVQPAAYVLHPQVPNATAAEFGQEPFLLQALLSSGALRVLPDDIPSDRIEQAANEIAAKLRESGVRAVLGFVDSSLEIDSNSGVEALGRRLKAWSSYQRAAVENAISHGARIQTTDGIEDDDLGTWCRSFASIAPTELSKLTIDGSEARLLAHLVRGIRYHGRTEVSKSVYQAHPSRRDFLLYMNLRYGENEPTLADEALANIRGVHSAIKAIGGARHASQFEIAEMVTPLLGGRLWTDSELGVRTSNTWLKLVTGRLVEYQSRAHHLRLAVSQEKSDEAQLRLRRDLQELVYALARDLGIRPSESTRTEKDLLQVASVGDALLGGLPIVTSVSVLLANQKHRLLSSRRPHAQFIYKELRRGYNTGKK